MNKLPDQWSCEAKVPLPERGNQKEYATRYVHRELAEKLMQLMVEHRGEFIGFKFDSRAWLPEELGFPIHGDFWIYRGTITELRVIHQSYAVVLGPIESRVLPHESYEPRKLTTREMLKELWGRYRRFMDSQEACSYTRPQSDYPRPEVFFM